MSGTNNRVIIFDTTMRDGEQSPGASMNLSEKLRIAEMLEAVGVDVIEAGFPAASQGHFDAVSKVAEIVPNAIVCGLARARKEEIDRCAEAIKSAKRGRIHTFIGTSPTHLHKLQMGPEEVITAINESVRYARNRTDDVEWSAEDASRTDPEFLYRCVTVAIAAGARTINIPDTVGYATPETFAALIARLRTRVPNIDQVVISVHCHNDLGLAVANSLAAVMAGARQVECTINGLGERAGNAALEEIVMALKTRQDVMPYSTGVRTESLTPASRLVASVTGFAVQRNKAIVGANAFVHESGIHQDGMLKNAQTYEIMTPESVGLEPGLRLTFGKNSGRKALQQKLKELGYELGENALNELFRKFKDLCDRKKDVFDEDIIALVDDAVTRAEDRIALVALETKSVMRHRAYSVRLELSVDGAEKAAITAGNGLVDAAFEAIKICCPHTAELLGYQVHAVTPGTDSQGSASVRLGDSQGRTFNGHGADLDVTTASAKAYLNALTKLLAAQERP